MTNTILVDSYSETEVRVWCHLIYDEDSTLEFEYGIGDTSVYELEPRVETVKTQVIQEFNPDLSPKTFGFLESEPIIYRRPEWFFYDVLEFGFEDLMEISRYPFDRTLEPWEAWAIREGIAPLQPFQIIVPKPHYSRDYYGEYDADYSYELGKVDPIPMPEALERWTEYFKTSKLVLPELGIR